MYENYYHLREKPFTLLPDPGFLYMSDKHAMALTLLEYSLMNHTGFTVISGEIGAGKTTLIRHILNHMARDHTVGLISTTHHTFDQLLQWILLAFNLDHAKMSKVEMYQRFVDFIIDEYAHNRSVVLIIDEAQNMPPEVLEELRMLSNINADKDQTLQVILVGQKELRESLQRPELAQFAQRISINFHLQPLSEDETLAYIRHRLEVAGGDPDIFDTAACRAVYRYSNGVPRLINVLCDTALVYGYAEQTRRIDARLVSAVAYDKQQGGIFPTFEQAVKETESAARGSQAVFAQPPAAPAGEPVDESEPAFPQPPAAPAEEPVDESEPAFPETPAAPAEEPVDESEPAFPETPAAPAGEPVDESEPVFPEPPAAPAEEPVDESEPVIPEPPAAPAEEPVYVSQAVIPRVRADTAEKPADASEAVYSLAPVAPAEQPADASKAVYSLAPAARTEEHFNAGEADIMEAFAAPKEEPLDTGEAAFPEAPAAPAEEQVEASEADITEALAVQTEEPLDTGEAAFPEAPAAPAEEPVDASEVIFPEVHAALEEGQFDFSEVVLPEAPPVQDEDQFDFSDVFAPEVPGTRVEEQADFPEMEPGKKFTIVDEHYSPSEAPAVKEEDQFDFSDVFTPEAPENRLEELAVFPDKESGKESTIADEQNSPEEVSLPDTASATDNIHADLTGPATLSGTDAEAAMEQSTIKDEKNNREHVQLKRKVQLALCSDNAALGTYLIKLLAIHDIDVVVSVPFDDEHVTALDPGQFDVLMISRDSNIPIQSSGLRSILASWRGPLLYYDSQVIKTALRQRNYTFGNSLASKIKTLADSTDARTDW